MVQIMLAGNEKVCIFPKQLPILSECKEEEECNIVVKELREAGFPDVESHYDYYDPDPENVYATCWFVIVSNKWG